MRSSGQAGRLFSVSQDCQSINRDAAEFNAGRLYHILGRGIPHYSILPIMQYRCCATHTNIYINNTVPQTSMPHTQMYLLRDCHTHRFICCTRHIYRYTCVCYVQVYLQPMYYTYSYATLHTHEACYVIGGFGATHKEPACIHLAMSHRGKFADIINPITPTDNTLREIHE